jgi:uncharacterized membrane protein YraQ (UPF0718 family)
MAELPTDKARPLWQTVLFIGLQVAVLVFATWGRPEGTIGLWATVYSVKWFLVMISASVLGIVLALFYSVAWWKIIAAFLPSAILLTFKPVFRDPSLYPLLVFSAGIIGISFALGSTKGESHDWLNSAWTLTKQILPLLLVGVLVAGFFLGRPGSEGIIPSAWVASAVGGNSLGSNLFASVVGAFMYFATLTEVPILQGLLGAGMGKGPALALLLAGPALSLPNMLVIRSVMGTRKTVVFVFLVVIMATVSGMIFGILF